MAPENQRRRRHFFWALGWGCVAAVVGLVVAPTALFTTLQALTELDLTAWQHTVGITVFECGLWGSGILTALAASRLSRAARPAWPYLLVALCPALAEMFMAWLTGLRPPALASLGGVAVRLLLLAATLLAAVRLGKKKSVADALAAPATDRI